MLTSTCRQLQLAITLITVSLLGSVSANPSPVISADDLQPIGKAISEEIDFHNIPGAVVLVGNASGVIYRYAAGNRAVRPTPLPMTADTIFDIASLTKPVVTATAIMQLAEQRLLDIDRPVAYYWPEFAANGKSSITIRQLLTHYSGLRADLDMRQRWQGYNNAISLILEEHPQSTPGTQFLYSDINYAILGELVHRISFEPLDLYAARHIFEPLGMIDTQFNPGEPVKSRIAPTEGTLHGVVHDPMARRMGGVAGHAGLFSTADDLARFARMLLNNGSLDGVQILRPETVALLASSQSPTGKSILRTLGWDLNSPYAVNQGGTQFPEGTLSHTGYTGTAMWIDPQSHTFVVLLSNRVHPTGRGNIQPLRLKVASIVAYAVIPHNKQPQKTAAGL